MILFIVHSFEIETNIAPLNMMAVKGMSSESEIEGPAPLITVKLARIAKRATRISTAVLLLPMHVLLSLRNVIGTFVPAYCRAGAKIFPRGER